MQDREQVWISAKEGAPVVLSVEDMAAELLVVIWEQMVKQMVKRRRACSGGDNGAACGMRC